MYGHWVVIAQDSDRGSFPPEIPLHSGIILCALSALGSSQGCIYISLLHIRNVPGIGGISPRFLS